VRSALDDETGRAKPGTTHPRRSGQQRFLGHRGLKRPRTGRQSDAVTVGMYPAALPKLAADISGSRKRDLRQSPSVQAHLGAGRQDRSDAYHVQGGWPVLIVAGICILEGGTSPQAEMEVRMAQQVNVRFVDDLDGSEAASTVSFGLDGRRYEIDLSNDNAAKLRDSLASFVAAARKSGGSQATGSLRAPKMTPSSGRQPEPLDPVQTTAIRAWARQNGHQVSARGRISRTVMEAFRAAH
jgi:hypothetical protein